MDAPATEKNIDDFVERHSLPRVAELDKEPTARSVLRRVFEAPGPKVIALVDYEDEEETKGIKLALDDIARRRDARAKFVVGDAKKNDVAMKFLRRDPRLPPRARAARPRQREEVRATPGEPWGHRVVAREVRPRRARAEREERSDRRLSNDGRAVKIVVASTFDEMVLDAGKDVFIEFYAPWCNHCKALAPIYQNVGEAFEDDDDVTIAKFDAGEQRRPGQALRREGVPRAILLRRLGGRGRSIQGRSQREGHDTIRARAVEKASGQGRALSNVA